MANVITGNPWSLTTAGVISNYPVRIADMIWQDFTPNGTDTIHIVDNAGRTICLAHTDTTGDPIDLGKIGWVVGFNILEIDSGVLIVAINKT